MALVTRQSMTDDSGLKTDGTPVNKAFVDQIYGQIDDQAHSTTNTLVKPKATTDEVIAARGASATVKARLDAMDALIAASVTVGQVAGGLAGVNLIVNDDFQLWPSGDTALPFGWTSTGAGVETIARSGTGLGDTARKVGDFAFKAAVATNIKTFERLLVPTGASFARLDFALSGHFLLFGGWFRSDGSHQIVVSDGATETVLALDSTIVFKFQALAHPINSAATKLAVQIRKVGTGTVTVYASGLVAMITPQTYTLQGYQPCPTGIGEFEAVKAGTIGVATGLATIQPPGPAIVLNVNAHVGTAPTGAAILIDVNAGDPTAPTTMFAGTKLTIAAGTKFGVLAPDGPYAARCLRHGNIVSNALAATETGGLMTVDIDQVGSGVAGDNLELYIRAMAYNSPLRRFLASTEI